MAMAAAEQGCTISVVCYTYGSPRVGNHAFAREYDKLVPHTWNIINNQVLPLEKQQVPDQGVCILSLLWKSGDAVICLAGSAPS